MPPLGFSTAIRKARELGRRRVALAVARPRMVAPAAHYAPRPHDGVLILQRGPNPSTDYYLRPRAARENLAWVVADLDDAPSDHPILRTSNALLVVICRYVSGPWLEALEAARPRLARVALFMDDDLPAMIADPALPASVRGKVAEHFGRHVEPLDALCSEVWLSTPALAHRYSTRALTLPPLPEADPVLPSPAGEVRVVYHGTDTHPDERAFVAEVGRRLAARSSRARVEVTGDARLRAACADLPNVEVVPQLAWPDYLARQAGRAAAMLLAPLSPSPVNAARAPVKAFDAARLGAAGLFADAEPYRGFVRPGLDGVLLPMDPDAWAAEIDGLLADPARRRALAQAAAESLAALRADSAGFPPPPGA